MQSPVQFQTHNMAPSEAAMAPIRRLADTLDRPDKKIMTCRIRVDAPLKKKLHGGLYRIRIDLLK
jgi:hypothetical protein